MHVFFPMSVFFSLSRLLPHVRRFFHPDIPFFFNVRNTARNLINKWSERMIAQMRPTHINCSSLMHGKYCHYHNGCKYFEVKAIQKCSFLWSNSMSLFNFFFIVQFNCIFFIQPTRKKRHSCPTRIRHWTAVNKYICHNIILYSFFVSN